LPEGGFFAGKRGKLADFDDLTGLPRGFLFAARGEENADEADHREEREFFHKNLTLVATSNGWRLTAGGA